MEAHITINKTKSKYLPENIKDTTRQRNRQRAKFKRKINREDLRTLQKLNQELRTLIISYEEDLWHSRIRNGEENGNNVRRMIKSQKKPNVTVFLQLE